MAREAIRRFGLDEVLFVPAATPPHKAASTPFADRYRMVELACADQPGFAASRIEAHREQSYSIITIEELKAVNPRDDFQFLIGADAFAEIRTWFRWEDVVRAIDFIVVSRPGHSFDVPDGARVRPMDSLEHTASSTRIRAMLEGGLVYDLPDPVAHYILEHELYGLAETGLPVLETPRLRLRRLRPSDREFLVALDTDPAVMEHIHEGVMTRREAEDWAESQILGAHQRKYHGKWIVELGLDATRLGWIEFGKHGGWDRDDTQVGYEFAPAQWGRGYAVEAVGRTLDWVFGEAIRDRIVALVRPKNLRSVRLLQKLGFQKTEPRPAEVSDRDDFYVVTAADYLFGRISNRPDRFRA